MRRWLRISSFYHQSLTPDNRNHKTMYTCSKSTSVIMSLQMKAHAPIGHTSQIKALVLKV